MKTTKTKTDNRYIVLVARSRKHMAEGLFSMCRFKGDDAVLFLNGRPVFPTLFKSRKDAEKKVGDQKMFLYHERCELKDSIQHLKQHGFVEEYPGIIDFVKKTAAMKHGLLGTLSPVFKIVETTQEKWDKVWARKGGR